MNSPPSQQNGISYSEFIIEVILPFGEQYQFECHSRATVDYVKNKIFKTHCSGFKGDKSEYVLQLSETKEFLFVEFLRFLSTDALKQRATAGLPIEVRLVTRDAIYDTREADSPVIRRLSKQGSHTNLLDLFAKQSKSAVPLSSGKETGVSNKLHLPLASLKDQPPSNEEWNSPPKGPRRRSSSITLQTSGLLEYHNIPNHALERTNPFKNSSKISSPKQSSAIAITNSENRDFCKTVLVEKRYSLPNSATFAPQWANESLSTVIEPNSMGYHTEVGDYGLPVAKFVPKIFEIEMPLQENLYEKYFLGNEHFNFIGNPENVGPVVVSLLRDKNLLRALIRVSEKTHHICTEEYTSDSVFFRLKWKSWLKSVLGKTSLCIPIKSLKKVKGQAIIQDILAFDQSHLVTQLKFGVLYCKDGQVTEDEWFGNEHGSSAFNEFLELLGERITLKGWDKFRAGLDTKTDTTGTESIYTQYGNLEIMFHVSTLLPFSEADQQKIERKRHLGNDIVVVIFMDGKTKFPPTACKSFFNHIYIVVQQDPKFENYYRVGVTIKDGVRQFGPSFPYPPLIHKDMIRDFLMTKMINGEWATYRSTEFAQKFKRTRNQQLGHLVSQY